jgi:tRNA threonylcarbamoyladenosine biosynthesis protein TsaB
MDVINHTNARYIPSVQPLAKNMMPLAERRFYNNQFEDVAYFTPDYLKAYQAKLPKNLLKS